MRQAHRLALAVVLSFALAACDLFPPGQQEAAIPAASQAQPAPANDAADGTDDASEAPNKANAGADGDTDGAAAVAEDGDTADGPDGSAGVGAGQDGNEEDAGEAPDAETNTDEAQSNGEPALAPTSNGFPDASNTGVPPGTELEKSGSIKVTKNGAVVDGKDVSGQITVTADNVTIRRTRVRSNGSKYAIQVQSGADGAVVEDVDLIGTDNNASVGIVYGNYTIRRADIRGFVDGPRLGSNTLVEDCYVHDTRKFSGTHNDAVQALGGTNIELIGNTLEGPYKQSTSAALLSANWSPLRNVVIRGNKLSGGGYTLYVQRKDGAGQPAPSNVTVEDNVWVKDSWQYGSHTIAPGADILWRNNRLSTGEVLKR